MKIIADLHIHSKYARATSKNSDLDGLSEWGKIKGIDVLATGDITHPKWVLELKSNLKELENGLYEYKGQKFILSGEIALFYKVNQESKRIHLVILSPSIEITLQINDQLGKYARLDYDGRPIISMQPAELIQILMNISEDIFIIPAHIWTPWFSLFGSKSGVDIIEDAFEDQTKNIYALETGLSSDLEMNWMLSKLDKYSLVSNSDSHSPQKIGREANVFNLLEVSYHSLINAIKTKKGFEKTYEFYPEEGKYHFDGHRNCNIIFSPAQSKIHKNKCPVCKKELTIGVMNRVYELADREYGFKPENSINSKKIVPLTVLISKILKKSEISRKVSEEYFKLVRYFGSEFAVYEAEKEKLNLSTTPEIANAINLVNLGKIYWTPGYDGVFGELSFEKKSEQKQSQKNLFDF
ncbi:MAG: endonuclease Q family protein [Candidatus Micrarchaeia archaeon]